MENFFNKQGSAVVYSIIKAIQDNKQNLSDIDGKIGDGDHGINMNKGFSLCQKRIDRNMSMSGCFKILGDTLMQDIGGSMGPLYGTFFNTLGKVSEKYEQISSEVVLEMLSASAESVREIGCAEIGDKTMLDCLLPAIDAYSDAFKSGSSFAECLTELKRAAKIGRDSTKNMVAKVGRASRLGLRSVGYIDAGAASCSVILSAFADSVSVLI